MARKINRRDAQIAAAWSDTLLHIEGKSRKTVYDYTAVLDAFLVFRNGSAADAARLQDLTAFLLRPRTKTRGERATSSTLARESAALRSFYRFAIANDYYERDPSALLPAQKRPKRLPKPVPDATWLALWSQDLSDLHRSFFGLAYFAGLRRAELARLETVKILDAELRVIRKGNSDDVIPYRAMCDLLVIGIEEERLPDVGPKAFLDALGRYARTRRDHKYFFPWSEEVAESAKTRRHRQNYPLPDDEVDAQIAAKRLVTYLDGLGMPGAFTLHMLRHSAATNLIRAGVPIEIVQKLLNHEDISTTTKYTQVTNADIVGYVSLRRRHPRN